MDNTVGSLTQFQKSLIRGMILGDGYIRKMKGRSDAFLEVNHSYKQKKYVDWKYSQIENICISPPKKRKGNKGRTAYRFFTRQHPYITKLFPLFYSGKKKEISTRLDIDKIVLAIWFMDDGSVCGSDNFYLNSQQFDQNSQNILIQKLKHLGLESSLNKDKCYFRIRFYKKSIPILKELIADYFIEEMKYKIK